MNQFISTLTDHATLAVAILAVVEGFLCVTLLHRNERLRDRLAIAQQAAEDAARAAALASPGGIDPEAVIALLRAGQPTTLDNVYAVMEQNERRQAMEEAARSGDAGQA